MLKQQSSRAIAFVATISLILGVGIGFLLNQEKSVVNQEKSVIKQETNGAFTKIEKENKTLRRTIGLNEIQLGRLREVVARWRKELKELRYADFQQLQHELKNAKQLSESYLLKTEAKHEAYKELNKKYAAAMTELYMFHIVKMGINPEILDKDVRE
jgi:hypothetical protein